MSTFKKEHLRTWLRNLAGFKTPAHKAYCCIMKMKLGGCSNKKGLKSALMTLITFLYDVLNALVGASFILNFFYFILNEEPLE
jgi:hypothetical protein